MARSQVLLISVAMALSAGATVAFVVTPASLSPARVGGGFGSTASSTAAPRQRTAVTMGLADAIPGPLKSIFSSKSTRGGAQRRRTEGAELYRTLGVTPDADYMEIMEATQRLKEKYAEDRRKVILLDKAKDEIMALRLKQAVKGTIKSTDEAKSKDNYTNAKAAYLKAKESELVLPEWTKGWINPPDREQFRQVLPRYLGFMAFTLGFPSASGSLQLIGGANCLGTIINRDGPDLKRDDNNQIAEVRLPARKTLLISLAITLVAFNVGTLFGDMLAKLFGEAYILVESWRGVMIQALFAATCLYVTTWRDPEDGPIVGRKPGRSARRD